MTPNNPDSAIPSDTLVAAISALRAENSALRAECDDMRKTLNAVLWSEIQPPTAEELASAEPIGPWFDSLVERLHRSGGE